jgi:hypothetical protein
VKTAEVVREEGGTTQIKLALPPSGSIFVVFKKSQPSGAKPFAMQGAQPAKASPSETIVLRGPWTLAFPPGWGAPSFLGIDQLRSWTELDLLPEGRAFSGTVTYTTHFVLSNIRPGSRLELDLGEVAVIARPVVNGTAVRSLWTPPYSMDVTGLVRPGTNHLSVEVTSTWLNRLVFDAGLEEKERKTWTISGPAKDRPLVPAGLLGPVTVQVK